MSMPLLPSNDPNIDPRTTWEYVRRCLCDGRLRPAAVWGWGVCESCGTWVNTHRPTEHSITYVYSDTYWTTTQSMAGCPSLEERFESDMNDRIGPYLAALLPHLQPGATVVESGCGNARLLHELKKQGFNVAGTEFNLSTIERVGKLTDVLIHHGFISKVEAGSCDAVVSIDVLEHVHHPRVFLRQHMDAMKPGGVMMIHTPVHETQAQVYGYSVGMLWKLYHLWLFSRPLLESLFTEAGLTIVDRSTVVFGWPVYILRKT